MTHEAKAMLVFATAFAALDPDARSLCIAVVAAEGRYTGDEEFLCEDVIDALADLEDHGADRGPVVSFLNDWVICCEAGEDDDAEAEDDLGDLEWNPRLRTYVRT